MLLPLTKAEATVAARQGRNVTGVRYCIRDDNLFQAAAQVVTAFGVA